MKYSDGLVSQLNVCDFGKETETKRRRTREEDWQRTVRERHTHRRAASAFGRCLSAIRSASPPLCCDGLWEVMTHDNFYCCIHTQRHSRPGGSFREAPLHTKWGVWVISLSLSVCFCSPFSFLTPSFLPFSSYSLDFLFSFLLRLLYRWWQQSHGLALPTSRQL